MTNDELKKKIVEILEDGYTPIEYEDGDWGQTYFSTNEDVADALIAAKIGDVKEAGRKAFVYSAEITHLDNKLKETEHRAEVAERALLLACANVVKDEKDDVDIELLVRVVYDKYLKQAEQLAEEKKDEQS